MAVHLKACRVADVLGTLECIKCSDAMSRLGCYIKGNNGYESYCVAHYREMAVVRGWNPEISRCCNQLKEDLELTIGRYSIDQGRSIAVLQGLMGQIDTRPKKAAIVVDIDEDDDSRGTSESKSDSDDESAELDASENEFSKVAGLMSDLRNRIVTPSKMRKITENEGFEYLEYDSSFQSLSQEAMLEKIGKYYLRKSGSQTPLNHIYVVGKWLIDFGFMKSPVECLRNLLKVKMTRNTANDYVGYATLCDEFPIMKFLDVPFRRFRHLRNHIKEYLLEHGTSDGWRIITHDPAGTRPEPEDETDAILHELAGSFVSQDRIRVTLGAKSLKYIEYDPSFEGLSEDNMQHRMVDQDLTKLTAATHLNHAYVLGKRMLAYKLKIHDNKRWIEKLEGLGFYPTLIYRYINCAILFDEFPAMRYCNVKTSKINKLCRNVRKYLIDSAPRDVHGRIVEGDCKTNPYWFWKTIPELADDDEPPRKKLRTE